MTTILYDLKITFCDLVNKIQDWIYNRNKQHDAPLHESSVSLKSEIPGKDPNVVRFNEKGYPIITIPAELPTMNVKEFDRYFTEQDDCMKWTVKINNPTIIDKDTLKRLRVARFNNPFVFHHPPTIRNKLKSIVTPVLMTQYFENIKLYESAIGAEYGYEWLYELDISDDKPRLRMEESHPSF